MVFENVVQKLEEIIKLENEQLVLSKSMLEAYEGTIYPFDILAIGALNRSQAQCSGFRTLIAQKNLICAGGILRFQLDTALRFFAGFLVSDPHKFAICVLRGEHIRNMTDHSGNKLTDRYLVNQLSKNYEWVSRVYDATSGYVHLSEKHIFSAFHFDGGEDNNFTAKIAAKDKQIPCELYFEAIDAFSAATHILFDYVKGWIFTKNNPEIVRQRATLTGREIANGN